MITTVTTNVSSTLTSATGASLVFIAIVAFVILLIQKEIVSGLKGTGARRLSRALNIALIPLLFVFAVAIAFRIRDVLVH
jgi:hypothetical protein